MNDIKQKFEEWLKEYSPTNKDANPANYDNIVVKDLFTGFTAGAESMQPEIDDLKDALKLSQEFFHTYVDISHKLRKALEEANQQVQCYVTKHLTASEAIIKVGNITEQALKDKS